MSLIKLNTLHRKYLLTLSGLNRVFIANHYLLLSVNRVKLIAPKTLFSKGIPINYAIKC